MPQWNVHNMFQIRENREMLTLTIWKRSLPNQFGVSPLWQDLSSVHFLSLSSSFCTYWSELYKHKFVLKERLRIVIQNIWETSRFSSLNVTSFLFFNTGGGKWKIRWNGIHSRTKTNNVLCTEGLKNVLMLCLPLMLSFLTDPWPLCPPLKERKFAGGSSQISECMAKELGERVKLQSPVFSIDQTGDMVVVETVNKETYMVSPPSTFSSLIQLESSGKLHLFSTTKIHTFSMDDKSFTAEPSYFNTCRRCAVPHAAFPCSQHDNHP